MKRTQHDTPERSTIVAADFTGSAAILRLLPASSKYARIKIVASSADTR
jgi:hypothetical protein